MKGFYFDVCGAQNTMGKNSSKLSYSVFFTKPVVGCMNFTSPLVISQIHTLTKWMKCTQASLSTIWGSYHHSWLLYKGTNLPSIQNELCHSMQLYSFHQWWGNVTDPRQISWLWPYWVGHWCRETVRHLNLLPWQPHPWLPDHIRCLMSAEHETASTPNQMSLFCK